MIQFSSMKKLLFTLSATFFLTQAIAQSVYRITITGSGQTESIAFEVEPNIIVNISPEGNIGTWGYDVFKDRGGENFTGQLQPYVGRVEYYGPNDDEAIRGKIKSIGRTTITWFMSYENDAFIGKIKSVGTSVFTYYDAYEDASLKGKIKSIGGNSVRWYASYNNEGLRGKLQSFGSTQLTYYNASDDKAFKGKIKSIDGNNFTYYSSFDRVEFRGQMKTGSQVYMTGGIKYFVRNY